MTPPPLLSSCCSRKQKWLRVFLYACLVFTTSTASAAGTYPDVNIHLMGAAPSAEPLTDADPQPTSLFLDRANATFRDTHNIQNVSATDAYRNVYAGISLAHFIDDHHVEFAFALREGADPSLIRFMLEGVDREGLSPRGHVIYTHEEGLEVYQHAPVIRRLRTDQGSDILSAHYTIGADTETSISTPTLDEQVSQAYNDTRFNLIPKDVGHDGPDYDYYMARFEVTNRQWVRFLNDAQQNPNNARGENLFFDDQGNVWFHPDKQPGRDEIFTIDPAVLHYRPDRIRGDRYRLVADDQGDTPYANFPVSGVSWFGALKYCNWLTLQSERGLEQRAYREGTNQVDWAPVTATNWHNGEFTIAERQAWIERQGFRLPMFTLTDPASRYPTNTFNEFYKAAAWSGQTNTLFGYGRNTFTTNDAVVLDTVLRQGIGLKPVGFFDGINRLPTGRTLRNENGFGIHDLTGNVSEWLNDFSRHGYTDTRFMAGGSFEDPIRPVSKASELAPSASSSAGGFRPMTTYMPESVTLINVLFCFHTTNDVPAELREKLGIPQPGEPIDPIAAAPGLIPDPEIEVPPEEDIEPPDIDIEPDPDEMIDESELPAPPGVLLPDLPPDIVPPPFDPVPGIPGPPVFDPPDPPDVPPPPPALFALRLESQNPNSGVPITVSIADFYGYGDGTTTFTRFYEPGTQVTLQAPSSVDNAVFQHWLRNGTPFSTSSTITVDMLSDLTFTAVYRSPQPAPRQTLTVDSTPVGNVAISVSEPDNNGLQDGITRFTRIYDQGQQVTVTAPPEAGGETFIRWLRNGQPFSNNPTVSVNLFTDVTLVAQYGQIPQTEERQLSINSSNPDSGVPITISVADNNGLQDGDTSLNRLYDFGTDLTVEAPLVAPNGNTFNGWFQNGVLISRNPQIPVSMVTDVILTADYISPPPDIVLTVRSDQPDSGVTMTVTTPDNDGLTDGDTTFIRHYAQGTNTTVIAPPLAPNGNEFRRWLLNGSAITTNLSVSVNLLADSELIAVYRPPVPPPQVYELQVNSENPDTGVDISVSVPDINNDTDGSTSFARSYLEDTSVSLTAPLTAPDGNTFSRWLVNGTPVSDQNTLSLIMNNNTTVTAVYEPPDPVIQYTLDVETQNPDTLVVVTTTPVDVNGEPTSQTAPYSRLYDAGTEVTITARNPAFPGTGIFLQQWLLDGVPYSTNATIQVTMLGDRRVRAIYGPPLEAENRFLTVESQNPDEDVPITVSVPDVNGDQDGLTTFTREYEHGEDVTLTSPPAAPNGNPFLHWLYNGILVSTNETITVSMLDDATVTAVYEDLPPVRTLSVRSRTPATGVLVDLDVEDINGNQDGETAFDREYYEGQTVTLTTTPLAPNGEDVFSHWERNGIPVTTNTTTTVTLYSDTEMTAVYRPAPTFRLRVRSENPDQNIAISVSEPDIQNRTDGSTTFDRIYEPGTITTVTAPENEPDGAEFVQWLLNGEPFSTDREITLEMFSDYDITAVYGEPPPPPRFLFVRSVNPDSDVPIMLSEVDRTGQSDGLTSFRRVYDDETELTAVAPPTANGNTFRQWIYNGTPITTNLSATVLLTSEISELIAVYGPPVEPQQRVLTVDSRNPFTGVPIEVSEPDVSGDTDGDTVFVRIYEYGDITTLVAPETAGTNDNVFLFWERNGEQFSSDQTVTVEMLSDVRMTAVYGEEVPDVTLTVESENPDSGVEINVAPADLDSLTTGTTTFERNYSMGQNVVLSAPSETDGQPFLRWLFNGNPLSTNNIVDITMLGDVTMTAVYGDPVPIDTVRLTVASEGPDGALNTPITASPDNNGDAAGTTLFERIYDYGDITSLTAPATSDGFNFSHWSIGGATFSDNRSITLTMLDDLTITAVYVEPPPSPSGL